MFDNQQRVVRWVEPPHPVLLHPARVWPPTRLRWGTDCPLIVRAQGLQLGERVPGLLRAWVRTAAGDWLGLLDCTVRVGGAELALTQLVPAAALERPTPPTAGPADKSSP